MSAERDLCAAVIDRAREDVIAGVEIVAAKLLEFGNGRTAWAITPDESRKLRARSSALFWARNPTSGAASLDFCSSAIEVDTARMAKALLAIDAGAMESAQAGAWERIASFAVWAGGGE